MATKKKTATAPAVSKAGKKKQPETAITVTETEFAHVVAEPETAPAKVETPKPEAQPKDGSDEVKQAWALEQGRALLGPHAEVWISTVDKNGKNFRTPRFRIGVPQGLYSEELQKRWGKYVENGKVMWGVGSNWTGAVNFLKGTVKNNPLIVPAEKKAA
jgi:hypothetical protein